MKAVDVGAVQSQAATELAKLLAREQIQRPEVPIVDGVMVPNTIGQTRRLAEIIFAGGMMPRGWAGPNDQPSAVLAKATIALSFAYRLKRDWTWALGAVAVVNGKPCLFGDALPDLIWASGKCAAIDETWDGLNADGTAGPNTVAVCRAKRSDNGAEKVYRFAVKEAQAAGLWGKSGPWSGYPKRMLQMRARAFCLRDLFADVLSGAAIAEEQRDAEDATNAAERGRIATIIDELGKQQEPASEPTPAPGREAETGDGKTTEHNEDNPPPPSTPEEGAAFVASLGLKPQPVQGSLLGEEPNVGTVDRTRRK